MHAVMIFFLALMCEPSFLTSFCPSFPCSTAGMLTPPQKQTERLPCQRQCPSQADFFVYFRHALSEKYSQRVQRFQKGG